MKIFPSHSEDVALYRSLASEVARRGDAVSICEMMITANDLSRGDRLSVGDACAKKLDSLGMGIPALVRTFVSIGTERRMGLLNS